MMPLNFRFFVSEKVAGETADLKNSALDRLLDFAAEVGLVVIIHNDMDVPFPKPGAAPKCLDQTKAFEACSQSCSFSERERA